MCTSLKIFFDGVTQYVVDRVPITKSDIHQLWYFMLKIFHSPNCNIIFRGESNQNFKDQYGIDVNDPQFTSVLFMIGEKGKSLRNLGSYFDIENTSVDNFRKICSSLNKWINNGSIGQSKRSQALQNFIDNNHDFCRSLLGVDELVMVYNGLDNEIKRNVNLYYLAIAHTINSLENKNCSNFISTSTNAKVAERFTSDATILGWVPKLRTLTQNSEKIIDSVDMNKLSETIINSGIPCYDCSVFPHQNEIALRAGFLPHFIIGIRIQDTFFINPAFMHCFKEAFALSSIIDRKQCIHDIIIHGLKIDQRNFEEYIRNTRFKRYYTFDGSRYVIHIIDGA